jgi:hypothetical protein
MISCAAGVPIKARVLPAPINSLAVPPMIS